MFLNVQPLTVIAEDRIVALVRAPSIDDPRRLAETFVRAGIRSVEFTLTTEGALQAIHSAAETPAVVGAGTVLSASAARDAIQAGATFIVSPITESAVIHRCLVEGVPAIPGALTPTEVQLAIRLGAAAVKIFPARVGGPAQLRDLAAVFPGTKLIPSGGIDAGNALSFLDAGAVAVSAGSSTAPGDVVSDGDYEELERRARMLVSAVNRASRT